ncbi:DUF2500 domain-containing protein [Paenibacillus tuaregi]|uniref:DUF2500 domain-containing protein n=1 Tax=Paenibacillus tuaregi TaxID=1816681 RepID=UPI0009EE7051|nr:DUF2500 domain-containing protein [Paenibacillus tuaregi]
MNGFGEMGFFDFMSEVPLFFKLFLGTIFILVIGGFLTVIIKGISTWTSNNQAELLTRQCKIVDKRTKVWGGSGDSSTNTSYFITFEFEDHTRKELQVKSSDYGILVVGDTGELTFQGSRFKGFTRVGAGGDW